MRQDEQRLGMFARGLFMVALVAAVEPACAERMGKNASAGAMGELDRERAEADRDRSKQVMRVAGARAVEGAVSALDAPAQREAIQSLIKDAVAVATATAIEETTKHIQDTVAVATATAVEEATRNLIAELGPEGRGPLGASLARTSEQVSAAAVGGIGAELAGLLPECNGPDRMECIDRRLQQTARTTAASFTSGVKESLGWQLLLVMFMLGAAGGVLGAWLWSLRPVRRREFRTA